MSDNIIPLAAHQKPVTYRVTLTHHYDGSLEIFVEDVADDTRSRAAVADALRRAAEVFSMEDRDE